MTDDIHVLIVADNVLARAGLVALLESDDTVTVIGQSDTDTAADQVRFLEPDVIVCDAGWQIDNRLDAAGTLAQEGVPLLLLLADDSDAAALLRILNGLDSYGLLLSDSERETLLLALHTVAGGLVALDPALSFSLLPAQALDTTLPTDDLTPREDEVLQLLAQGLTNKAIAHQLGITEHTVKFHVTAIMSKFHAQSRTDAVVKATRAGLVIL
jgi:DNA-binding NarL/FixJ family response regulator